MGNLDHIPLIRNDGSSPSLKDYRGQVLSQRRLQVRLIPRYMGLQKLYNAKRTLGLEVLGFPANDFHGQEPGTDEKIAAFCSAT